MHRTMSSSRSSYERNEPSEPQIHLRLQFRVLKWALMPIYFLVRSLWKLLSWCWHVVSVRHEVGSDRHRWDWRSSQPAESSQNAGKGQSENGRFSHIAQLLLAARGSLAFCNEDWVVNLWKVPVKLSSGPANENLEERHLNVPLRGNGRSQEHTHGAHAGSTINGRTVLHLPPQDLIELLVHAR